MTTRQLQGAWGPIVFVGALAVLLGAVSVPALGEVASGPAKLKGNAPRFSLPDQNGKNVSLGQFSGKFVVIEFINADCLYTKRPGYTKTMQSLVDKYKRKDVVWVGVHSSRGSNAERNRAYMNERRLTYSLLDDSNLEMAKAYNVTRTPAVFIVDRNGSVVYLGAVDNDDSRDGSKTEGLRNYIDRALGELVSGAAVSIPETTPYGCELNKPE